MDARAMAYRTIGRLIGMTVVLTACSPAPRAVMESAPTPSVSSFTLTTYRRGVPLWRMDADRAVFGPDGASADVFQGEIQFYGPKDYVSRARFERAVVNLRTRDARFPGHAVIHTVAPEEIRACDMVYISSDDTVRSERPVTVVRPREVMKGSGFIARNGFQEIVIADHEIIPR